MRWVIHVARMGVMILRTKNLVGKAKSPFRRPRCTEDQNIKMDVKERGCEDVEWTNLTQDRYGGELLCNCNEPPGSMKEGRFLD